MKQIGFVLVFVCCLLFPRHARAVLGVGDLVWDPT